MLPGGGGEFTHFSHITKLTTVILLWLRTCDVTKRLAVEEKIGNTGAKVDFAVGGYRLNPVQFQELWG